MKYPYNHENFIVEIHMGKDVFHKDYGREESCALRAIERLVFRLNYEKGITEIRLWHAGSIISKYEASE